MLTIKSISPIIYFANMISVIRLAKSIGEYCPYWINEDILNGIDKIKSKNIREKTRTLYFSQCHKPEVFFRPYEGIMCIRCIPCDFNSSSLMNCNLIFPKTAEKLLISWKENESEFLG